MLLLSLPELRNLPIPSNHPARKATGNNAFIVDRDLLDAGGSPAANLEAITTIFDTFTGSQSEG
jgi:hypothetical protein